MMSSEITMAALTHPLHVLFAAMLVARLVRLAVSARRDGRAGRASRPLGIGGAREAV